jgi:Asp-tRNA(Asn)/Glu-tRNA(Gln) amidotransferase A subunit family amidase
VSEGTRGLSLSVEAACRRIDERNRQVRAVLHPLVDAALVEARLLDQLPTDRRGPLHRVPYVLKDVWDTAGIPTTGGSLAHRSRTPLASSPIHAALSRAGAVLLGKSNVSDLAFTPECDNLMFGPTSAPHDVRCTSGGSSGGAAAAVADGMAAFDWGSDFGGSIRLPAAFCGVVGLRLSASVWPPAGSFPGAMPLEFALNGMGPIAHSVEDCRVILSALAPLLRVEPAGSLVGASRAAVVAPDGFSAGQWPSFQSDAFRALAAAGVDAQPAALPAPREIDRAFAAFLASHLACLFPRRRLRLAADVVSGLFAGVLPSRAKMHPHTARVLTVLAVTRASIYSSKTRAVQLIARVRDAAARAFDDGRLLVAPTTGFPAPLHGRAVFARGIAAFAKLGNILDATAVAVPFGSFSSGAPRSIQILGPPGSEDAVLDLAESLTYRR